MEPEPVFEKSISLPMGYVLTARATPATVRRTIIHLVPWALYAMLPPGRRAKMALAVARRFSPLVKQKAG